MSFVTFVSFVSFVVGSRALDVEAHRSHERDGVAPCHGPSFRR